MLLTVRSIHLQKSVIMSNRMISAAAALLLIPFALSAQGIRTEDPVSSVQERASAALDWKIAGGTHLQIQEEARFSGASLDRTYSTLGVSWKCCDYLKIGGGYSFIWQDTEEGAHNRHRAFVSLTGMYRYANFKFSLREKFQATYKAYDINEFQKPKTAYVLKSRLKLAYHQPGKAVEPYAYGELRTALNAVDPESLGTMRTTAGNVEYSDVYNNRTRAAIGMEWHIDTRNVLDFYAMYDWRKPKVIDASAKGRLKDVCYMPEHVLTIGVAYTFGL